MRDVAGVGCDVRAMPRDGGPLSRKREAPRPPSRIGDSFGLMRRLGEFCLTLAKLACMISRKSRI